MNGEPARKAAAGPIRAALRRGEVLAGLLTGIAILCAAGIILHIDERNAQLKKHFAGDRNAANRIDLAVRVQKVDALNEDLVVSVLPTPRGALVQPDRTPVKSFTVDVGTTAAPPFLRFPAGLPIVAQTVRVGFQNGGTISDYPLDHYTAVLRFISTLGDRRVPSFVTLREADPFFLASVRATGTYPDVVLYSVRVSRSRGTLILAWFIIVAMWALALAVLGGALDLISRASGVVWPALAWMAATIFALVGMRNAAPGSPPIGSLIDYAAFFWAEAIVTVSLISTVISGIHADRAEMKSDRRS
jgi:hypothetical protein